MRIEAIMPANPEVEREVADTGVNFASWYSNDIFVTGSSDGIVKVWNPKSGNPFCYDLASFNAPITAGSFSSDHTMLLIGENTGQGTLLSHLGDGIRDPFTVDYGSIDSVRHIGMEAQGAA